MAGQNKRLGGFGVAGRAGARAFLTLPLALLLAVWSPRAGAAAQGGHTLYGDFKIDAGKVGDLDPATFNIILYSTSGRVVSRQSVTDNGRYRFLDVPNGEYDIVVEAENTELARIRVQLAYSYQTDHRQDILMEARAKAPAGGAPGGAKTVSAADLYKRSGANDALFKKAETAVENKDYGGAISLLRQVVGADPNDFAAWTQLGTLLFAQKAHAEAESAYLRALEAQPSYFLALLSLGRLRMTQKNFEGAAEALSRAAAAQPRSATAHFLLGESYLQIKKGSKAVVHLNEALRLDPQGKADAHLRLAALYNAAGLKDRAAAEYEQFLLKKPGHPGREKLEQYISENKKR